MTLNFTDLILQAPLAAGALFLVYLFLTGKLHTDKEFQRIIEERDGLQAALETERKASTELARTGSVTNQLLDALVSVTKESKGQAQSPMPMPSAEVSKL